MDNARSFYLEARFQGACRQCGRVAGRWEAHHVVEKQELRRSGGPLFDPRNALRLCSGEPGRCHGGISHHRVELRALTDDNIAFAFEELGPYAYHYFKRHYDGDDQRLEEALVAATNPGGRLMHYGDSFP